MLNMSIFIIMFNVLMFLSMFTMLPSGSLLRVSLGTKMDQVHFYSKHCNFRSFAIVLLLCSVLLSLEETNIFPNGVNRSLKSHS